MRRLLVRTPIMRFREVMIIILSDEDNIHTSRQVFMKDKLKQVILSFRLV